MLRKSIILALLILMSGFVAHAQFNNPRGRVPEAQIGLSVGGKIGSTVYFGDLVDGGRARWTIGGFAEKQVMSCLGVRLGINVGQCTGKQDEGLEFKTFFTNAELMAMCYFLDLIQGYDDGRLFSPYVGAGAGGIFFSCEKNPVPGTHIGNTFAEDVEAEKEDAYSDWRTYDGGMEISGFATGLVGVQYSLTRHLWLNLDVKGDLLFTDTFDGHDGYPGPDGAWVSGDKFDAMYTISLGVRYRFNTVSKFTNSSKYSRKSYLSNKRIYERNAKRMRRR